ncbi:two-component system response regulator [Dokdonia sp. MED134]|uniref:response regulator n=1 Tax=Dokdonia sp. MED134 TaxID=313590 RepID=UPI000068CF4B|nr:response regulator [Dokdonia sp. MED134]EAQ39416.1 two-component system response regulator [Dokdonia sp. MED134]
MKRVLLIDDDKAVNFFNKRVVVGHSGFEHIKTVQSGKDGLLFLEQVLSGDEIKPDIIFLDINMPAMNGWEFLDHYELFNEDFRSDIQVIILSSSSNPEHVKKSIVNYEVLDFINKPLSFSILDGVLETVNDASLRLANNK